MATYKQRTSYHQRHTATYSDDEDGLLPQQLIGGTSSSSKHPSSTAHFNVVNLASHPSSSHHHFFHNETTATGAADDDFVENTSDREWTSIRNNSVAAARAKVRQQQYLDQQQQRTREWQLVLSQHHHRQSFAPSFPSIARTNSIAKRREVTSDDYDEILLGAEESTSAAVAALHSPFDLNRGRESATATPTALAVAATGAVSIGEDVVHSSSTSVLGFSDLTSDGLESMGGESEDLGVWSHEEEEEEDKMLSLSNTPLAQRSRRFTSMSLSSRASKSMSISTTASLSKMQRPSFATVLRSPSSYHTIDSDSSHHTAAEEQDAISLVQNQMPFHDGSGNFFEAGLMVEGATPSSVRSLSLQGCSDMDLESEDRGWESSSSRSSTLKQSLARTSNHDQRTSRRRRISSTEFKAVIQNIADLQHTERMLPSQQALIHPHFTYPNVVASKRHIFNIYESEMEDMADMVSETPTRISWLQAFEKALSALRSSEYEMEQRLSNLKQDAKVSISALAQRSTSEDATFLQGEHPHPQQEISTSTLVLQEQVKHNMAAASMETMKRLQNRKRPNAPSHPHPRLHQNHHHRQRYTSGDPMQIDFSPTLRDQESAFEDAAGSSSYNGASRKVISRSTGTTTTTNRREANLLAVVLSTLRRFRDHVQSNLMYADFYDDHPEGPHHRQGLGLESDLGIAWSSNGDDHRTSGTEPVAPLTTADGGGDGRLDVRTSSYAVSTSTSSRSSSRHPSMRRVSSDCGLESMKQYRGRADASSEGAHLPMHSPNLVES
ncbi:hypothetical protein EDD11_006107 [Mortierella claussenii]|nr:hypothetical protein EDD11_006107 [Mortierella claussenii]